MNDPLSLVVVVLAGVALGAFLGAGFALLWHRRRSSRFRAETSIPDILGKWRCRWFDDAKPSEEPKVEDTLEVQRWTHNGEFVARGHQPQFHLDYPVTGEIDPSRIVTLIYQAARYPYEPNRGVVCLELSRDGQRMEGRWFGRRFSGDLGGGKVICNRIDESMAA